MNGAPFAHDALVPEPENPFLDLLGARRTEWRDGYAQFELRMHAALLNRQGVLQGGLIATLLDAACGYAGLYVAAPAEPQHGLTLSLTCSFLDRGRGERIVAATTTRVSGPTRSTTSTSGACRTHQN